MSLIRIIFILMAVNYVKMFLRVDTRIPFAALGLPVFVVGFVGIFVEWPVVVSVALVAAGYTIMRRQANMRSAGLSQNTLRNGAVVTALLVVLLGIGTREYLGITAGIAIAAGLLALHYVPTPSALD